MRRGVWLFFLGVLAAALAASSARADGTATTASSTTTATTASYAPLSASTLPVGCVGAGAAAVVEPGRRVLPFGTPASGLGASAWPTPAPVVAFGSSTAGGSTCKSATVKLD